MSKFTIEYAKDCEYVVDDTGDWINLTVKFEGFAEEQRYSAWRYDTEGHGRLLWQNATNGDYGPIAPYVAPEVDPKQKATEVVSQVTNLIGRYKNLQTLNPSLHPDVVKDVTAYVDSLEDILAKAEEAYDNDTVYDPVFPERPKAYVITPKGNKIPIDI